MLLETAKSTAHPSVITDAAELFFEGPQEGRSEAPRERRGYGVGGSAHRPCGSRHRKCHAVWAARKIKRQTHIESEGGHKGKFSIRTAASSEQLEA